MMVIKKILIYDSSKAYSRFLRLKLKNVEVHNFINEIDYNLLDDGVFFLILFIINKHVELLDLFNLKTANVPFCVGSPLVDINAKIKNLDSMIYIDVQSSKIDILNFIEINFDLYLKEEGEKLQY